MGVGTEHQNVWLWADEKMKYTAACVQDLLWFQAFSCCLETLAYNMQLFCCCEDSLKHAETHHWEVLIKNATEETAEPEFCCSVKCSLNGFEDALGEFCCYSLFCLVKMLWLKETEQ